MITYLYGKLAYKDPAYVIIDIQGVGYQVFISLNTYSMIKDQENIHLNTYLHIKEDAHVLYGFRDQSEKEVFLRLIGINGVGPNTALMILSSLSPLELEEAVRNDEVQAIQKVKGIGGKTAQRIVLELKDQFSKQPLSSEQAITGNTGDSGNFQQSSYNTLRNEALSALATLGITRSTAEKAIDTVMKKEGYNISVEELIKKALKST